MSALFSTVESVSLERNVDLENKVHKLSDIWDSENLNRCIKWTKENNFNKICLQFSDNLINHSIEIERQLKKHVESNVFILADTSYGSCCVDEIAAAHVNSDCLIHFGHACLSKVTRLPVLYIFPKYEIDVEKFVETFKNELPDKTEKAFIFYDVGSYHAIDMIANKLNHLNYINIEIGKLAEDGIEPDILCWSIKNNQNTESCICVYVGRDNQSFFNISMSLKCKKWLLFETNSSQMREVQPLDTKWLKRRYYYIEKCKDAQTLGIVVGTLTSKGYLDVIKHVQELARKRGIKTYIFSVGKVNPAKLANFTEIDCFVLIGCSENNLYTSRDFYKPLISIFEVEMALNPAWHMQIPESYSNDFREILPEGKLYKSSSGMTSNMMDNDVSLVTGKVRQMRTIDDECASNDEINYGVMQERNKNQIIGMTTLNKFQDRTFQGLDPAMGKDEPSKITQGRKGIPIKYEDF